MTDLFQQLSDAMAQAVTDLTPSLVTVNGRRRLSATGVIHSADGLIVTAHHVIERDDNITVVTHDGASHNATLLGRDPQNDLALLKVNASGLPAIAWADDHTLRVGNLVLALGKPGEQTQATLGVVSAIVRGNEKRKREESSEAREERGRHRMRRRIMQQMGSLLGDGYIQTDVVMYPGFSGGPLVSGALAHGLNTSGFRSGASLTVPVSAIRQSIATLQTHGKVRQGYIGVGAQPVRLPAPITQSRQQETGLLLVSVEADSPAANGGLIVGDIIVSFDEVVTEHVDDLLAALAGDRVGQSVAVELVRGGELKTLSVTVGERS